jgi:hypothetical protein
MATWNVYAEIEGSPIYGEVDLDDDLDEDEAFEAIVDIFRSTLQIDR